LGVVLVLGFTLIGLCLAWCYAFNLFEEDGETVYREKEKKMPFSTVCFGRLSWPWFWRRERYRIVVHSPLVKCRELRFHRIGRPFRGWCVSFWRITILIWNRKSVDSR
jgi:hypothetical protein